MNSKIKSLPIPDGEEEIEFEETTRSRLNQILSTLAVCFLCISCGNILGYTSSAVPSMREDMDTFSELTPHDVSWIGSLGPLGAMCGGIFTIFPLHYLGPRRTIFYFGAPLFIISWIVIALSYSLWTVWIGRFIGGLGTGMVISCSPLYVVDIASLSRRGRLGVLPQGLMLIGILTSYILGNFLTWRQTAVACGCISSSSIGFLLFAPDSPKWLISRDMRSQALTALKKLHGNQSVWSEFHRITRELDGSRSLRKLQPRFSLPVAKSCAVALTIMSFQQLSGINGITFYAVSIFRATKGVDTWGGGSYLPPIILALVQCISSMTSCLVIEKVGRRYLLLLSSGLICFAAGIMGCYFYIGVDYEELFWVPLATLILYTSAFAIGFGPVAWIIVAEILPAQMRNIMNPLVIGYTWFCVFLVTKSFPLLVLEIHIYGIFWIYAIFSGIAFVFVFYFVPETKGKTSSEIQTFFGEVSCDTNQNFSFKLENSPDEKNCLTSL